MSDKNIQINNTIQEIIGKGELIKTNLDTKITALAENNGKFRETLLIRLKDLLSIANNLQKIKETKATELKNTKDTLNKVNQELEKTQQQLSESNQQLITARQQIEELNEKNTILNNEKTSLTQQITQLNNEKDEIMADYTLRIENIKRETSEQIEKEKRELKQEFDTQINLLNSEIENLKEQFNNVSKLQEETQQKLMGFQGDQEGLIGKLNSVNEILNLQLQTIQAINEKETS